MILSVFMDRFIFVVLVIMVLMLFLVVNGLCFNWFFRCDCMLSVGWLGGFGEKLVCLKVGLFIIFVLILCRWLWKMLCVLLFYW